MASTLCMAMGHSYFLLLFVPMFADDGMHVESALVRIL